MNMVFTMGFRVQIFGRRCALEPSFFFVKRQYTEQLTDKQGEQFWAVSTCQKQYEYLKYISSAEHIHKLTDLFKVVFIKIVKALENDIIKVLI
jgi:hypothetical protein